MPNKYEEKGRLVKGSGGLFTVILDEGTTPLSGRRVDLRAKGTLRVKDLRHKDTGLLPGDRVLVSYSDSSFSSCDAGVVYDDKAGLPDGTIISCLDRKNSLIRPAMANLDRLYIVLAAARPDPSPSVIDKLISVCEYSDVEPVIVIGKKDLSPENTEKYKNIYEKVGYRVFALSCATGEGVDEFISFVRSTESGSLSAFAGASGAGKTTLLSKVFPDLDLRRGDVSVKTGRGRHTTRTVELYEAGTENGKCLIADTPGFSAIDFVNFDFLPFEALAGTMKEFLPYYEECRWPDCSHTKEEDCGVVRAVKAGKIAQSRFDSYVENYGLLKHKNKWD